MCDTEDDRSGAAFLDRVLSLCEQDGHDTTRVREALAPYLSDADDFDVANALYWYGADYHGGQWSLGYALHCATRILGYRPSPIARGPEPESLAEMIYQDLANLGEI